MTNEELAALSFFRTNAFVSLRSPRVLAMFRRLTANIAETGPAVAAWQRHYVANPREQALIQALVGYGPGDDYFDLLARLSIEWEQSWRFVGVVQPLLPGYYVDATHGDNAKDGRSPGNAWKTIAKVNGTALVAGDHVYFKRGETWPETLTAPASGAAGNPIVFGCFGSNLLPLPVINGGGVRNQCIALHGRSYVTVQDIAVRQAVWDDLLVDGAGGHNIIQRCTTSLGYTGITVRQADLSILNCTFDHASLTGLYIDTQGSTLHVSNCEVRYSGDHGVKVMADNGIYERCNVHHSRYNGFYVEGRVAAGLSADNNIFRYNWCHENGQNISDQSNGAEMYNSGGDSNQYLYNICGPGGPGAATLGIWFDYGSQSCKMYNNTIYHMRGATQGRGYKLEDGPEGVQTQNNDFANNLIVDCYQEGLEVYDTIDSGTNQLQGNTFRNNLIYRGAGADPTHNEIYDGRPATRGYKTLAAWKASPGNPDSGSLNSDPLLVDPAHGDFRLQAGSPAIGAGIDLGASYQNAYNGTQTPGAWCIGAMVVE